MFWDARAPPEKVPESAGELKSMFLEVDQSERHYASTLDQ